MKFSVLMSVYMKEKPLYFRASIDSLLNQSCIPNQIVIVKDGKLTKELDLIIEEYKKQYFNLFKIVELEKNVGLGLALCEGIKHCDYNLIARMDTDDICRFDRFEKQISMFKEDKDLDIVGSYINEFDVDINNIISIRKVPITNSAIKKYLKRRCPFNHMTVMYKKKTVIEVGNYKAMHLNEDYYLWSRMIANNAKCKNIPEALVYARTGTEMFQRRGGIAYCKTDIVMQNKLLELGLTNKIEFLTNIVIRVTARLVPNKIRKLIYLKLLRK